PSRVEEGPCRARKGRRTVRHCLGVTVADRAEPVPQSVGRDLIERAVGQAPRPLDVDRTHESGGRGVALELVILQLFNGISLFTILLLMSIGLAIVFGLMGVINMAHGELMALGAYVTYLTATLFERALPSLMDVYIFVAVLFAFLATFAFG